MATKLQEVVALIDRSGSMAGKVTDAVGGFNSTLEVLREQKEETTQINVSVKLFDNEEEMLIKSIPLNDVRLLEERQFVPRGQTALLDAMGNTLTYFMEKKLLNPDAYECCTIYVVTDGLENCSKTFTQKRIKDIIKSAEDKYNIKVIYLGANQDAILEATNLGINPGQAINYTETKDQTSAAYRSAAAMVYRHRSGDKVAFTNIERQASQCSSESPHTPSALKSYSNYYDSTQPLFNMGSTPSPPPVTRQMPLPLRRM